MAHVTFPKDSRGTFRRERRERQLKADAELAANKQTAKVRDSHKCRWPGCECSKGRYKPLLESAHIEDRSTGGSDETENLFTCCDERHRGTPSLHSKDLAIEKLTPLGANGLLAFYQRDPESGRMECIAVEKAVGISETRGQ